MRFQRRGGRKRIVAPDGSANRTDNQAAARRQAVQGAGALYGGGRSCSMRACPDLVASRTNALSNCFAENAPLEYWALRIRGASHEQNGDHRDFCDNRDRGRRAGRHQRCHLAEPGGGRRRTGTTARTIRTASTATIRRSSRRRGPGLATSSCSRRATRSIPTSPLIPIADDVAAVDLNLVHPMTGTGAHRGRRSAATCSR